MKVRDGVASTTTDVWHTLVAAKDRDLPTLRALIERTPELVDAQYNYMPPLHLAVREGHADVVHFLLEHGAARAGYGSYPFHDDFTTIATDRGYTDIARLLAEMPDPLALKGEMRPLRDNGDIDYGRDSESERFQKLVDDEKVRDAERMLEVRPDLALDETAFWGEGIMCMPSNSRGRSAKKMLELLYRYGARVPDVAKWAPEYYFKYFNFAELHIEHGMSPNHMTCHRTTLLHSMAYRGEIDKARLLLDRGANMNAVDEEFRSTPLGLAARWGQRKIVQLLLDREADPDLAGADWATPLAWARKKGHADIEKDLRAAGARD